MKKLFLTTLVACGFAVVSAQAGIVSYSSRAAWEVAVGGLYSEEDFNSYTSATSYQTTGVDVGDFTVSMTGSDFGSIWHNIGPVSNFNDVNGTGQINAATGSTGGTTLTWDSSIYAFGAYFKGTSDSRVTKIMVNGDEVALPDTSGGTAFFGYVSDTAFTSELLFLFSGPADGFGIDNVVYSDASVPDSGATLALLGSALFGLAALRRRAT